MPRPLCDSEYIFGMHDPGGEQVMLEAGKPGWVLLTIAVGSDPNDQSTGDFSPWSSRNLGVMVRLNNGYEPAGTIPLSRRYEDFARRCGSYVRGSRGCHIWIIGNEMNFLVERPSLDGGRGLESPIEVPPRDPTAPPLSPRESPYRFDVLASDVAGPAASRGLRRTAANREVIAPQLYARCYRLARAAIHAQPGHEQDQVLVGAVAPWNDQTKYPENPAGDWVRYFRDILELLGPDNCDGFTLHSYTHGDDPNLIHNQARLNPPFQDYHYHFFTYRDFMAAVPASMRHLPAYITEADQDVEWRNENRGWVSKAYAEIDWWNNQPGNQQIRSLVLYRWPRHDRWYIEGKQGVIDDFRQALRHEYKWRAAQPPKPAYRVAFLQGGDLRSAQGGQVVTTRFVLRNDGSKTWRSNGPHPVRLGFHWESDDGKPILVPGDRDFRAPLPQDVEPGATVAVEQVKVAIPEQVGVLRLRWDLVEEGMTWFKDQGSSEKVESVIVTAAPRRSEIIVPETGKRVVGPFLEWYQRHGLDVTGYPVTEQAVDPETGLTTQYFQRVVMEEYETGRIRLRLAGQDVITLRARQQAVQAEIERLRSEAEQARAQLDDYQARQQAAQREATGLRSDVQKLQGQVSDLQEQLRRARAGDAAPSTQRIARPDISDISDQLPRNAAGFHGRDSVAIRYLVINHTGGQPDLPVERIADFHQQRGYPGIAYHFLVTNTGAILQTNPLADVVSDMGYLGEGVNIALAGRFDAIVPDPAQLAAAAHLCAWLLQELGLQADAIKGVSEFVTHGSPGAQWLGGQRYKNQLLAQVAAVQPEPVSADDPEIARLQAQLAELQGQLHERESQLAAQQASAAQLQQALDDQRGQVAQLEARASQLTAQVAEQQAELGRLRAALAAGGPAALPPRISAPSMQDVVETLPKHKTLRYDTRQRKAITHIAIHHSAASATKPVEEIANYQVGPDRARNKEEWPGIGYHFYVKPNGVIYQTNQLETVSYHVGNSNHSSLGVCVAGDFTRAIPTQEQLDSAAHLVAWLMQELGVPEEHVIGHKEFPKADTSCPGEQWLKGRQWKPLLLERIRAVQTAAQAGAERKSLHHYLLFWQKPDTWAQQDWEAAVEYIARFRPTAGFSTDDARAAEFVTIVGGVAGVSYAAEQMLRMAGCKVERLAGVDFADTKRILDELAQSGRRFRDLLA